MTDKFYAHEYWGELRQSRMVECVRKPVEAVQFYGNFDEIERFVGGDAEFRDGKLLVATRNGPLWANRGDYIFKNDIGEFESCDELIFISRYKAIAPKKPNEEGGGNGY